ncbi:unnamed protein product [Ascophyllum nodosum]
MNVPRVRRPREGRGKSNSGEEASGRGASSGGETSEEELRGKFPWRARRRRPWLRAYFVVFVAVEILVLVLVDEFSPRYNFEITSVTATPEVDTVVGANPNLLYPIKLAGQLCRPAELAACVGNETSAATLATVCCTELLDPFSEGPEETISLVELFGYVLIVPAGLILLSRGFLLGRVWALRPWRHPPCGKPPQSENQAAWGKRRWHLRVGFFALDSFLGLGASVVTATLFTYVAKASRGDVTTGRPRPNYFALRLFSEYAANGDDFKNHSIEGWPSVHASSAMAGLLFLALVLWQDLLALMRWRRHSHPRVTLVLTVLGGFAIAGLPMSAILIGVSRIRDYAHYPDDVLAGLALGTATAYWSFRFLVIMPFRHEIGSPQWRKVPRWVEEEEREWAQEEGEVMRLCPWKGRKRRGRIRYESADGEGMCEPQPPAPAATSTESSVPRRAPEVDDAATIEKYEMSPV